MYSISILAVALGLGVLLVGDDTTAFAATSGPPQTTPLADCLAATAAGKVAGSTCAQGAVSWRIVEQRPGFWTLDQVTPGSNGNAADPQLIAPHTTGISAPAGDPSCTSYPLQTVVNGQPQQATIVACPQADGGWQTTQYTPGLPPQVFTVPAQSAAAASPDDYGSPAYSQSWDWPGVPWFYGFAPVLAVGREFDHFHHVAGRSLPNGFGHGFTRGFGHGFAHGVAARHGGIRAVAVAGHGGFAGMHR